MLALRNWTQKTLKSSAIICNVSCYFSTVSSDLISEWPSSANYDELINRAGRERDFATVQELLSKRFRDGFFNTSSTFKFLSTDLSKLDDLLETLARLEKGFHRKSSHDCLIAQLCRLHRMPEATRVAEIMVRENYGANACTFHPILSALTKKKAMDEAWRTLESMREWGIKPDLTAYNYILTAYCFSGDLNSTAAVLSKMVEREMGADSRTYDALVLGACRAGKLGGALRLLRRMVDEGVPPLYSTHAHVINAMMQKGYYMQGVEFVLSYAGNDCSLDRENFELLANRLINRNRIDETKMILLEMVKRDLRMAEKLKKFYHLHVAVQE